MTEHDLTESQLVGSRIRDARINRRMSQADLAAKANISLPHVSNIEKGKTSMKLETFIRIIEALQVSADSLLRPDVPEVRSLHSFSSLLACYHGKHRQSFHCLASLGSSRTNEGHAP